MAIIMDLQRVTITALGVLCNNNDGYPLSLTIERYTATVLAYQSVLVRGLTSGWDRARNRQSLGGSLSIARLRQNHAFGRKIGITNLFDATWRCDSGRRNGHRTNMEN